MFLKSSVLLFLIFLFSSKIYSQSDELIYSGLDKIYELKFDEAKSYFTQAKQQYPNDIKGFFYESLIPFYSALSTKDERYYDEFINVSADVIKKCDELLRNKKNDPELLFYKGQSHSYRSLLMLSLNRSLLRAASNGNDGYRLLANVVKNNPDYYDAYMGLGLYKIAIGFVPGKFQWLLSIIGFNGNIKEGINDLKTAMNKGKFSRTDAKIFLAFFSIREPELKDDGTVRMLKTLVDEKPDSPVFLTLYAGALQLIGRFAESVPYIERALNNNRFSLQDEVKKGAYVLLGNAYYRANDFQDAINSFEEHLKYVNDEDRYNISLFTIGLCYELLGNRQRALSYYSRVRDDFVDERDGEFDKLFYRYAKQKIKDPVNSLDSILIVGMNMRENSKLEAAIIHFEKLLASEMIMKFNSDDERARIYTEVAATYNFAGNESMAIDYYTRVSHLNPKQETWLVPYAYFELGKIYDRRGEFQRSREMFDRTKSFKDFDLSQGLEMRILNYRENR